MATNATEDSRAVLSAGDLSLAGPSDRRSDIEAKQIQMAELFREAGADGLLVLQPENFAWLTGGGTARGVIAQEDLPGLYFTAEGRWVLCSNADTQRLFDEEVDGLGFQLKEWPWHWGRAQLLADLCQGRKFACDVTTLDSVSVAEPLSRMRRTLSDYDRACYRALGQVVSHALEATARTFGQGDTEREVAGQITHRLVHRGAMPVSVTVAADGRSRNYRQGSFTATPIRNYCVLRVVARKYGLCAAASRSVSFGPPDPLFRREHDAACKICATYVASSWPDSVPRQILAGAQRIFQVVGAENEWFMAPQGHVTGRAPVEMSFTLKDEELLQANWAVTWQPSVGAALSCDTFVLTEDGARSVTAAENWPLKRIRTQGSEYVRPDVLIRT